MTTINQNIQTQVEFINSRLRSVIVKIRILKRSSLSRFDLEVQTEQSNDARPTVPLIAIGHYPAFDDARNNNDFQSQVDRLRDMSLERNKELPR